MGLPLFNIAMTVGRTRVIRKVEFTTTWTTTANAAFKLEGLLYLTSVEVISDFATISSAAGPLFLDMYRKLDDETFTSFVTSLPIVHAFDATAGGITGRNILETFQPIETGTAVFFVPRLKAPYTDGNEFDVPAVTGTFTVIPKFYDNSFS